MREHDEVIRAWLDGKSIQHFVDGGWTHLVYCSTINPISRPDLEWRIKPKAKQVDYQALIDSRLFVLFSDYHENVKKAKTSRLKSAATLNFKDEQSISWHSISFDEELKQVTTQYTAKKLQEAGFIVEVEVTYSNDINAFDDELAIVRLLGINKGYTL